MPSLVLIFRRLVTSASVAPFVPPSASAPGNADQLGEVLNGADEILLVRQAAGEVRVSVLPKPRFPKRSSYYRRWDHTSRIPSRTCQEPFERSQNCLQVVHDTFRSFIICVFYNLLLLLWAVYVVYKNIKKLRTEGYLLVLCIAFGFVVVCVC